MKFRERMLVMLVATMMLVAGSLAYFAYAADVEPYAVADPLDCPSCSSGRMTETFLRKENGASSHLYLGELCIYLYISNIYKYHCDTCDYYPMDVTHTYTYNHTRCGQ